jgi:putative ABC transport system permease protein
MVKSFTRLQHVDLGFAPDRLLTFEIELPQKTYPDVASVHGFYRRTLDRMRALPGVEAVTLLDGLPPNRPINANDLSFPDRTPPPKGGLVWNTDYWQVVADDGIEMLGMKIVKGRDLSRNDVEGTPSVVVVNQAFADKFMPGEDPIGQRVQVAPWGDAAPTQTIVGVVANSKHAGIDRPSGTEAYLPLWQAPEIWSGGSDTREPERSMYVMIRTKGDPAAIAPAAQRTLRDLDPTLAASKLRTMDDVLWEAVARPRFIMFLLGSFALLALALAAIGIYGVMSYSVAQRTHELGIRAALGARPEQLRAMVLRQGAAIVAIGVGVGLVAAFALQTVLDRALASVLYGASIGDPTLFVLVTSAVVATAFLATWIPARRATRVPPTVALRSE